MGRLVCNGLDVGYVGVYELCFRRIHSREKVETLERGLGLGVTTSQHQPIYPHHLRLVRANTEPRLHIRNYISRARK